MAKPAAGIASEKTLTENPILCPTRISYKLDPLPPRKLAKPLTREEIQAILPKLKQFGYNGAKIPVFPPDPTLSLPIQSTSK